MARAGTGDDLVDLREDLASIVVHGTRVTGGIADVPHELAVERDVTAAATRHNPLVLGHDARRFWHLTLTLATTDFKLRFYGSALGYAWTLVRPFAFFGVIWFVFSEIVARRRRRQELPGVHPDVADAVPVLRSAS